MYSLTIPGEPIGKARARVTRWGTHTPEKTVNYETQVKERFASQYPNNVPNDMPLSMKITAYFSIPKGTSNKRKELMMNGEIYPVKRPDIDNVAKIVLDALNKIAYVDDSQVVNLSIRKYYGVIPQMQIEIKVI